MAVLREQAQFDTEGAKGFDRGGFDWALQSLTYTLKIYNTSGAKVAEIAGDLKNPTLTNLEFELLQQGGCGSFSFTLAKPYTQATIDRDYRVEIYMFNHWSPWYTGKIINKPIEGTEKPQTYSGWGYFNELEKKIIDVEISPGSDYAVAVTSLLDTYITPYTSILKDTDLIETVGHDMVATYDYEDEYADEIFKSLAKFAVDYKFGVNEDRTFYFQAIDTSISYYWHVGKHLTEFLPEEDPSELVKKVIAVYPETFTDGYRLKITSEAGDYAGLYDKRFSLPEAVNPFSTTNIASGITPSTSPAGSGAANLCDGDYSTLWESDTNQASGHYIKVDLGASYDNIAAVVIDSIHTNAQEYNAKSIKIEISSDDITYTTMLSSDDDIGWKPTLTFRPTAGRYVKLSLTQASSVEWKVGEVEIYQLDLTDAQRWADGQLAKYENVKKRATARMAGVDKFLIEKPVVAPIRPKGKARIFDRNGTAIDDYQVIACKYSLSSGGFNLDLELGAEERTIADEMKDMERRIRENENTGVRRSKNLSLSKGFQLSQIKGTYIGEDEIYTKQMAVGTLIVAGKIITAGGVDIVDGINKMLRWHASGELDLDTGQTAEYDHGFDYFPMCMAYGIADAFYGTNWDFADREFVKCKLRGGVNDDLYFESETAEDLYILYVVYKEGPSSLSFFPRPPKSEIEKSKIKIPPNSTLFIYDKATKMIKQSVVSEGSEVDFPLSKVSEDKDYYIHKGNQVRGIGYLKLDFDTSDKPIGFSQKEVIKLEISSTGNPNFKVTAKGNIKEKVKLALYDVEKSKSLGIFKEDKLDNLTNVKLSLQKGKYRIYTPITNDYISEPIDIEV